MGEWMIPVEPETGVPLAIEPSADLTPPGSTDTEAAYHHVVYPGTREELWIDSGDKLKHDSAHVMRQARLEWLMHRDHQRVYHPCLISLWQKYGNSQTL